jgi:predicted O-methyltransferase YrrM
LVWSLGPVLQNHYPFQKLAGVEINKDHAQKCQKNFDKIRGTIPVTIYPEDAFHTIERYSEREIDLLYLDANGIDPTASARKGHPVSSKNINFSLLQKVYPKLKPGAVALCHNAYQPSFAKEAADYLRYTAQEDLFENTVTVAIDEMGVEFSIKHI